MNFKLSLIISLVFLSGCASSNPNRQEIISWAKHIANIENRMEVEIMKGEVLTNRITHNRPTENDLKELIQYNNNINSLYNELIDMEVPSEAKSAQEKYIRNYADFSDSIRNYLLLINTNDVTYYDKSVEAAQEANQSGVEAYKSFEALINKYSISCDEIDFCE